MMEAKRKVRFDGKHWIGRKYFNDPMKIHSSDHVAEQAKKMLGPKGIVAIPNASPDDLRYEEVVEGLNWADKVVQNGSVFYDKKNDLYLAKAQEVETKIEGQDIVFLAYNLPWGIEGNLNDEDGYAMLEEARDKNAIIGITGPSCVKNLEKLSEDSLHKILGGIDFFLGYCGSETIRGTNNPSIEFYNKNIQNSRYKHIGLTAASGGHRTPRRFFKQSLGTSYTEIDEPRDIYFITELRRSLRDSRIQNLTMKSVPIMDTIRHGLKFGILDKVIKGK